MSVFMPAERQLLVQRITASAKAAEDGRRVCGGVKVPAIRRRLVIMAMI